MRQEPKQIRVYDAAQTQTAQDIALTYNFFAFPVLLGPEITKLNSF